MPPQLIEDISNTNTTDVLDHLQLLSKQIGKLYKNDEYSDVSFKVQGQVIRAHKSILAIRSEYFQSLLFGGAQETTSNEIDLASDTPLEGFQQILSYIYTGKLNFGVLSEDQLLEALVLSHKYRLTELEDSIQDYVTKNRFTTDNVSKFISFNKQYNFKKFYEACSNLIDEQPSQFLGSEGFLAMSANSVHANISRDSFALEEKTIFLAAKKWCKANNEASENDRDLVMSSVRLNQISRKDLLAEVGDSKLFSPVHILAAIENQDNNNVTDHRVTRLRNVKRFNRYTNRV